MKLVQEERRKTQAGILQNLLISQSSEMQEQVDVSGRWIQGEERYSPLVSNVFVTSQSLTTLQTGKEELTTALGCVI